DRPEFPIRPLGPVRRIRRLVSSAGGPLGTALARVRVWIMARRLGTILVDMGYLDEEGLWKVIEEPKRSDSELIGKVAGRPGVVKEAHVLKARGEQLGMKVRKLEGVTIPSELTDLINETMATAYKVVPVSQNKKDKSITVAMAEPQNPSTLDSLRMFL